MRNYKLRIELSDLRRARHLALTMIIACPRFGRQDRGQLCFDINIIQVRQHSEVLSKSAAQLAQGDEEAIAEGASSVMTILTCVREIRMRFGQEFPASGPHRPQRRYGRRRTADLGEGGCDFLPNALQRTNNVVWNLKIIIDV